MDNIKTTLSLDSDEESQIDDCTFVKLVECRPWLYDAEHPKYKNNMFKEETWRLIANSLGWEDDEGGLTAVVKCKSIWKRLRDNFMRALRKLPSGAGADDVDVLRKKPIYNALMFLRKIKIKNTRKSSGNFNSSAPLSKKGKMSSPFVPREQWSESIILNDNPADEDTPSSENKENMTTETRQASRPPSFEQPGCSGTGTNFNESSPPLPFGATIKSPPPKRINPPVDRYAQKKEAKFNKFEEMLSKGFESLNSMLKTPVPAPKSKSANDTFCEYILSELEEFTKQKQAAVRQQIILLLNKLRDDADDGE